MTQDSTPTPLPAGARALLDYWFADAGEAPVRAEERISLWFMTTPAQDEEMRDAFGALMEQAFAGELHGWDATPHGRLALVLLLDQLPRNLRRGSATAFAGDARALGLCLEYLDSLGGADPCLSIPEQVFMAIPLEHAEDRDVQRRSVSHAEALAGHVAPEWKGFADNVVVAAREHADIVERFGRFPHRNAVLGRTNTDREQQYLDAGAKRFGQ